MSEPHPHYLQQMMINMFESGISASAIAKELGLFTTSVTRVLKRHGFTMTDGKGKNHPFWRGGRGKKSGYWTVYAPDHPRAMSIGRVWEHILVAEKKLGRSIPKEEPIHHIDLDRLNNDPDNLVVLPSNSAHQQLHASLDRAVSQLIKSGAIRFDGKEYRLGNAVTVNVVEAIAQKLKERR